MCSWLNVEPVTGFAIQGYFAGYLHNPTCITVCIENARYSSYVLFCNTTAN